MIFLLVAQEKRSGNHQIRLYPPGNTNVCTKFHGNPSSSYSSYKIFQSGPDQHCRPKSAPPQKKLKTKIEKEKQVSRSLKTHTRVTWRHLGFELVIYTKKHYHHYYTEWHNASIREYTVHIQEVCVCTWALFPILFNKGSHICWCCWFRRRKLPSRKIITDIRSTAGFIWYIIEAAPRE